MGEVLRNPKRHDQLFKWLIRRFINDFFALFFPEVAPRHIRFMDKEFLERLDENKAAVMADLFLALQAKVKGQVFEVVIILEFKSRKEDVRQQIRSYFAHALCIQKHPVWSIVMFTDDGMWQPNGPIGIPVGYSYSAGFTELFVDVIKLKALRAETLIKQRTLLGKLLALKANDENMDRSLLIEEIYLAKQAMKAELPQDIDFLIDQFVRSYGNLEPMRVQRIKEEAEMILIAPTITEHYQQMFELQGKIKNMTELFEEGDLSEARYQELVNPLKHHLAILKSIESEELYQQAEEETEEG